MFSKQDFDFVFPRSSYEGCTILLPIAKRLNLSIDQFNFVFCQVISLFCAALFRHFLFPKSNTSIYLRHSVSIIVGFALGFFCFGNAVFHLFWQALAAYVIIRFFPSKYQAYILFIVCMSHLSVLHISRVLYDYLNYTVDVTCPMMISTQKLTALGFAVSDGRSSESDKLTNDQKEQEVSRTPSLLQIFSYVFNFYGLLAGPLCFFKDYVNFIEGKVTSLEPNTGVVLTKCGQAALFAACLLCFEKRFPVTGNISSQILNSSLFYRLYFLYVSCFIVRSKYYFAWKLGEAVNNAAGFGFNGYNADGKPKWNLLKNVSVTSIEFGTSFKQILDNWNIQTTVWLRRVCYDRIKTGRTLYVYMLSAFWHGFYPGYYLCFSGCALLSYTGRGIRRKVRPLVLSPKPVKFLYDIITHFASLSAANYMAVSFQLMDFHQGLYFFKLWWFCCHIFCIICCLIFPVSSTKRNEGTVKKLN